VSLAAAAALCRAAGAVALPYPAAASLVRDPHGRPTAAVPATALRVDHGDLFAEWRVGVLEGPGVAANLAVAGPVGAPLGSRLGPFVVDLAPSANPAQEASDTDGGRAQNGGGRWDLALQQTLVAWTVLGTLDRAVGLAIEHVTTRVQFGKPISSFQAVQFQVADAAVAVAGLRELSAFTLWRLSTAGDHAITDVLALRLHTIEVARTVLRTAQQLHGAAGVCDEYDVSVLTRMVQPALRLPTGAERTATQLAAAIRSTGFDGLFVHGALP
jgi:hypothetical protein